jgi:hypothetical protein
MGGGTGSERGGTREIARRRLPRRLVQRGPALAQGVERSLGGVEHVLFLATHGQRDDAGGRGLAHDLAMASTPSTPGMFSNRWR